MSKQKNLWGDPRVVEAQQRYIKALEEMPSGPPMAAHLEYLTEKYETLLDRLKKLKKRQDVQSGMEHAQGESEEEHIQQNKVLTTQIGALEKEMLTMRHAIVTVREYPEQALQMQERDRLNTLHALNNLSSSPMQLTPRNRVYSTNVARHAYLKETNALYEPMDAWYALGNEFAINEHAKDERAYRLLLTPRSVLHAKWQFIITLAETTLGLGLHSGREEHIDNNALLLMSRLLKRLSFQERGGTNEVMPDTHKFRHNPAIHSINVATLTARIFDDALVEIKKNPNKKELIALWKEMRQETLMGAMLHDCGELDGELSEGVYIATLENHARACFNEARDKAERTTFKEYLPKRKKHLFHHEKGRITNQPIREEEWQALHTRFMNAFDLAEKGTFSGRLLKMIERVQSQHDYLRFENLPGTPPLRLAALSAKIFSMNYPKRAFEDRGYNFRIGGEEYSESDIQSMAKAAAQLASQEMRTRQQSRTQYELAESYKKLSQEANLHGIQAVEKQSPGPHALHSLAMNEKNANWQIVYTALARSAKKEYDMLMPLQAAAYNVKLPERSLTEEVTSRRGHAGGRAGAGVFYL